jgi:hypothetical protein
VPFVGHSAKALPSVRDGTRQKKVAVMAFGAMTASLPSVLELALCRVPGTWRSAKTRSLCRVSALGTRQSLGHFAECLSSTLGKVFFKILFCFFSITGWGASILHRHVFTQAYYLKFHIHNQIHPSLIITQPNLPKSHHHTTKITYTSSPHKS